MPANFGKVADDGAIKTAVKALNENGFETQVVDNREAAKAAILKLIPAGSEVLTTSSITLMELGLLDEFNSEKYVSVRSKIMPIASDPNKQQEVRRLASAPHFVTGSVHAVTQDGHLMIASASGSQIAPEVYGASKVVFLVGAQKIVKNIDEGMKRIHEYTFPLEDKRALKAYGAHSSINKLLIYYKERPERVCVIIIKENIGY